jgi:hypothetical protein
MAEWTNEELETEFGVDLSIKSCNGISIGDTLSALEDSNDDSFFEGDEGIVLGFIKIEPATDPGLAQQMGNDPMGGTYPLVEFDGMDPVMVRETSVFDIT